MDFSLLDVKICRIHQANGQVKVTNRTLLNRIKCRLEDAKGKWPEELLYILWAYRTTLWTTQVKHHSNRAMVEALNSSGA